MLGNPIRPCEELGGKVYNAMLKNVVRIVRQLEFCLKGVHGRAELGKVSGLELSDSKRHEVIC